VNAKGRLEEYGKEREMTFSEGNLAEPTQRTKQTKRKTNRSVIRYVNFRSGCEWKASNRRFFIEVDANIYKSGCE